MCLNVYLAQYFVYPHPAVAVPAYGAYLLAAEVEDEIAETCILSQRCSRDCKFEVGDSSLVRVSRVPTAPTYAAQRSEG